MAIYIAFLNNKVTLSTDIKYAIRFSSEEEANDWKERYIIDIKSLKFPHPDIDLTSMKDNTYE